MRMIDADKFKEDLLKLWDYSSVDGITATTVLKQVISDLDNAPTVDIWQLRQEATENALKKAEVLYGRPKGEWIEND